MWKIWIHHFSQMINLQSLRSLPFRGPRLMLQVDISYLDRYKGSLKNEWAVRPPLLNVIISAKVCLCILSWMSTAMLVLWVAHRLKGSSKLHAVSMTKNNWCSWLGALLTEASYSVCPSRHHLPVVHGMRRLLCMSYRLVDYIFVGLWMT